MLEKKRLMLLIDNKGKEMRNGEGKLCYISAVEAAVKKGR